MLKFHSANNSTKVEDEWVVLKVTSDCMLNEFLIMDKTFKSDGSTSNVSRHVYIFPKVHAIVGDTIYLHTRVGKDQYPTDVRASSIYRKSTPETMHFFWNHSQCVWNNSGDVITIFKTELADRKPVPAK